MKMICVAILACGCLIGNATTGRGEKPEQQPIDEKRLNEAWNALSPREKASALRMHKTMEQMPVGERKFIRDRIERFINMTPEERGTLRENNELWKKMTPDERQQARDKYKQHRKEFEEKWRQEHPGVEPPPFLPHPKSKQKQNQTPEAPKESQP